MVEVALVAEAEPPLPATGGAECWRGNRKFLSSDYW